jgi:hypothetical protein
MPMDDLLRKKLYGFLDQEFCQNVDKVPEGLLYSVDSVGFSEIGNRLQIFAPVRLVN